MSAPTATIRLVRHGEAAAGFGDDLDPGLSPAGAAQAAAVADVLAPVDALVLLTSPLRRARETGAPLATRWEREPAVEPAVGEVVTPTEDLSERSVWLRRFLAGTWSEQPERTTRWRDDLVACLVGLPGDAVIFSHFVAINAAVSAALGDDRTTVFRPGYCSVTTLATNGRHLEVVELGGEAATVVRTG